MAQAFTADNVQERLKQLDGWKLQKDGKTIYREFAVKNFVAAVDLINRIAPIAEGLGHHPDLHLTGYRHLRVELTTHSTGGLSEKDFLAAAKINDL